MRDDPRKFLQLLHHLFVRKGIRAGKSRNRLLATRCVSLVTVVIDLERNGEMLTILARIISRGPNSIAIVGEKT